MNTSIHKSININIHIIEQEMWVECLELNIILSVMLFLAQITPLQESGIIGRIELQLHFKVIPRNSILLPQSMCGFFSFWRKVANIACLCHTSYKIWNAPSYLYWMIHRIHRNFIFCRYIFWCWIFDRSFKLFTRFDAEMIGWDAGKSTPGANVAVLSWDFLLTHIIS